MATTAVPRTRIAGGSFLLESRQPDEIFTPEDFSEQHQMIGQTAEEFAVNEIVPNIEKIEHKDFSVTRDLLKKAGELGLSSVEIPEAYGGLEMDKVTAAVTLSISRPPYASGISTELRPSSQNMRGLPRHGVATRGSVR